MLSPAARPLKHAGAGLSVARGPPPASYAWSPAAALVAVLARLPFLARPARSRTRRGTSSSGQQWHSGGSSLYGSYWVDRPPLLITVFRLASELGGLVPLRLIGCLAAALLVLTSRRWLAASPAPCGSVDRGGRCACPSAPSWVRSPSTASCSRPPSSPAAWRASWQRSTDPTSEVPQWPRHWPELPGRRPAGEAEHGGRRCLRGHALLLAWRRGEIRTSRLLRLLAASAAGAVVCLAVTAVWTLLHGTSLTGVFDAMYPFRIEAARVMAATPPTPGGWRGWPLLVSWVASGGAAVMLVVAWALVSRRLEEP